MLHLLTVGVAAAGYTYSPNYFLEGMFTVLVPAYHILARVVENYGIFLPT